jgi:hypothetical protein
MKMKQMFKFFVATAAIAAGITACSKEEVVVDEQPTLEHANLTITVNNNEATTRAIDDPSATNDEKKIENISLFIFGSQTAAEKDTVFTMKTGSQAGFEEDGANAYKFTLQNAPIGPKKIFVGVNLSTDLHNAVKSKGVAAAFELANKADLKAFVYASDGKGFPMFSDDSKTPNFTIKKDEENKFETAVKRFVAKVTVETTDAFEKNTNQERTVDGMTVNHATLAFAMGQTNRKFYPYPQKLGAGYEDPNYIAVVSGSALNYAGDFINEFYDFASHKDVWTSNTAGVFDGFKNVTKKAEASDITKFFPAYVLENTSQKRLDGELTYAYIKAKFTPAYIHEYDAATGVITSAANTLDNFAKLYVFNNSGTFYYLKDETQAIKLAQDKSLSYETYTDCFCFYMVNLNTEAKNYDVYRNDYYKLEIEKVLRIGDAYQGPEDPTAQKGGKADLQVKVTVQKWNVVGQPVQLGQ